MAGTGVTSDISNLIVAGITFTFNEAAANKGAEEYPQICTQVAEEKAVGIYESAGDISKAELKTEGAAITYESGEDAYETTITTQLYAKGVRASYEEMKNDMTKTIQNYFGSKLVRAMVEQKEEVVAEAYNNAFATTAADGVYVISDSHPLVNSAALNDNLITGDISSTTLKTGITQFTTIKNQAGDRFPTRATHILVHPSEMFNVVELLNSTLQGQELSNTTNSIKSVGMLTPIFNNYLDSKVKGDTYTPWFLLDKTLDKAGCILQYRGGMKLDLEEDFDTKDWKGTCIEEYAAAFVSPGYGIVGSLGT